MAARPPILCAFDLGARSERAVQASRWLAGELGAPVVLAHVFDPLDVAVPTSQQLAADPTIADDLVGAARGDAARAFAEAGGLLAGTEHTRELLEGTPVPELLELARRHEAGLLVTATEATAALERFLQGSVTTELAALAPCPVIAVAHGAALAEPGPIVVAFDGSHHSVGAARHGAALAARMGRGLVLVYAAREHDAHVPRIPELGVEVELDVVDGDPVESIARAAAGCRAALLVAGTRGRSALTEALLGSVSAGLIREAGRPVALVSAAAAGTGGADGR
jgi:nucleotide-binding universal stress UspA family protein